MTTKICLEKNYLNLTHHHYFNNMIKILIFCFIFFNFSFLSGICEQTKNQNEIQNEKIDNTNNEQINNNNQKQSDTSLEQSETAKKSEINESNDYKKEIIKKIEKELNKEVLDKKLNKDQVIEKSETDIKESISKEIQEKTTKDKIKISEKKIKDKHVKKEKKEPPKVRGELFVESIIQPIDFELNERFWGWRPNDILNVTDNINNMQKGILEVTRRAVIVLANIISRTGTHDSYDENVECAMNWFMVKADKYWFPSPESKYNEGIDELKEYCKRLNRKVAHFYIRTDNLIPLLSVFEDLLGSCDKNLLKTEDDSKPLKSSKVDDIFYYSKGVASAMHSILHGAKQDYKITLDSIQGSMELLDRAIEYLKIAKEIEPWLVTNGSLSSVFANHRANMSQPLNQSRYYLGQLIKTLKGY